MGVLSNLEPASVFYYFEEICGIPHTSHHEKALSDYCVQFAKAHGLSCRQDEMRMRTGSSSTASPARTDPVSRGDQSERDDRTESAARRFLSRSALCPSGSKQANQRLSSDATAASVGRTPVERTTVSTARSLLMRWDAIRTAA